MSAAESHADTRLSPVDAVLLALLPGALALLFSFGPGVLTNLLWTASAALLAEAIALRVERSPWRGLRSEHGTLLVAALLALSLPPACPWWLTAGGAVASVTVGRRLRDENGRTLFNPAMLAYAMLLVCFPREISHWIAPEGAMPAAPMGFGDSVRASLGLLPAGGLDGFTMATPLEVLRQDSAHTVAELRSLQPQFGRFAGRGWEWANAAFLAGGMWLAWRRTIDWRAPTGMLLGLGTAALLNDDGSSASGGPVLFHLLGGGTMLAAFFILTEPGTRPRHPHVRLASGVIVGVLAYLMRSSGGWPDGIAFAVLAVNAMTPFVERLVPERSPRAEGEGTRNIFAARRHLSDVLRIGALVALLALDWRGATTRAASRPEDVVDGLLRELADSGYERQERFSVQDPALLGLPAAREAWRLSTASGATALVLPLRAHEGYGGPMDLLLAVDERGRVLAVRVTAHTESPGFADPLDATDHAWFRSFEGHGIAGTRWSLRKDGGDFDGFTGATVTPRAIVAAVRSGLQYAVEHQKAPDMPSSHTEEH